jgi:hypothetical protein
MFIMQRYSPMGHSKESDARLSSILVHDGFDVDTDGACALIQNRLQIKSVTVKTQKSTKSACTYKLGLVIEQSSHGDSLFLSTREAIKDVSANEDS